MGKKQAIAVLAVIVLLVGAGFLFYNNVVKPRDVVDPSPLLCTACGHLFIPRSAAEMEACPKCSSPDLVTVHWYKCQECGKVFIGYEANEKTRQFRFPDGEWTPGDEFQPIVTCPNPECGSRRVSYTDDAELIRSAIEAMQ